ncbi:invasion associated locus B family protein [Agarivorans sp. MS3-6]
MKKITLALLTFFLSYSAFAKDFEAWTVKCPAGKPCVITQMIMKKQDNSANVIAGVSYFNYQEQAVLKIRISAQADPTKGIGLKFDEQKPLHLPITNCDKKLCEVNVIADQQLINDLQNGKVMSVAYLLKSNQQQTAFPVILTGFKQAYSSIH